MPGAGRPGLHAPHDFRQEHYGPGPGDPGHLAWYPEAMGLAASGDLAWSLGPWVYSAKKGGTPLVHGHFLSLWRRQRDGRWKVEADIGVSHPAAAQPAALFAAGVAAGFASGDRSADRRGQAAAQDPRPVLQRLESELSRAWAAKGGSALLPRLARDARILRRGHPPLRGVAAITGALLEDRPGTRWEPGRIKVSRAGDLAWTCGETLPDEVGASASYLRIWIQESGTWRVLFDVRVPHPARANKARPGIRLALLLHCVGSLSCCVGSCCPLDCCWAWVSGPRARTGPHRRPPRRRRNCRLP